MVAAVSALIMLANLPPFPPTIRIRLRAMLNIVRIMGGGFKIRVLEECTYTYPHLLQLFLWAILGVISTEGGTRKVSAKITTIWGTIV